MFWPRSVRSLSHIVCLSSTRRAALTSLAVVAPNWLRTHSQQAWVEHAGPRGLDSRLSAGEAQRRALAEAIREQGRELASASAIHFSFSHI